MKTQFFSKQSRDEVKASLGKKNSIPNYMSTAGPTTLLVFLKSKDDIMSPASFGTSKRHRGMSHLWPSRDKTDEGDAKTLFTKGSFLSLTHRINIKTLK